MGLLAAWSGPGGSRPLRTRGLERPRHVADTLQQTAGGR